MRALLFLFSLSVAPCLAQPATVDGELALGLLRLDSADGLKRGAMPNDLRPFLPDGATVVGSLDAADEMAHGQSRSATVLARLDGPPRDAAGAYAGFEVAGFQAIQDLEPADVRGFITSTYPTTSFTYQSTEGGDAVVHVSFSERPWGGSFVTIHKRGRYPFEGATRTPDEAERQMERMRQAFPALSAPADTRLAATGGGGGVDRHTDEAVLYGAMALADVADHFGRQIAAAGWAPGGATATEETAASLWTRTDGDRPLTAMFYARRMGPERVGLRMHIGTIDG